MNIMSELPNAVPADLKQWMDSMISAIQGIPFSPLISLYKLENFVFPFPTFALQNNVDIRHHI